MPGVSAGEKSVERLIGMSHTNLQEISRNRTRIHTSTQQKSCHGRTPEIPGIAAPAVSDVQLALWLAGNRIVTLHDPTRLPTMEAAV
jgi:hypothetical protein